MSTMPDPELKVILGVDTHECEHVAALIDLRGRLLATKRFDADLRGFRLLLTWTRTHGRVTRAGVEGTGSFGVGLARFLITEGLEVFEVTRPSRRGRRHLGKSDTVDAEAAARMVLSGQATATPKPRNGIVESIRVLQIRVGARSRLERRQDNRSAASSSRHLTSSTLPSPASASSGRSRAALSYDPDPERALRDRHVVSCAASPAAGNSSTWRSTSSSANFTPWSGPRLRACSPSLASARTPPESFS